ncbi:MAG: pirin family protein [Proteobacteria bacterium]|nr:pirin family protein [Pseudomonadota bacterium]
MLRPADARGHANHGWLDSHHTFSFANYFDTDHMGFGPLRVINEDRVAPGMGFSPHGHRDMEIISYVVEGALEHKDSMGSGSVIRPGDVQVMSAGSGVRHSEFNASKTDPVHFLQIWILPEAANVTPRYAEKTFSAQDKRNRLALIVSGDGREGSLMIHQKADLYATLLDAGTTLEHKLAENRVSWVQVVAGAGVVNGVEVRAGDGVAILGGDVNLSASAANTELLVFDLPGKAA